MDTLIWQSKKQIFSVCFSGISLWLSIAVTTILTGCGGSDDIDVDKSGIDVNVFLDGRANSELDAVLTRIAQEKNIENAILMVDVPKHGYRWHKAVGIGNSRTQAPLSPEQNFRTGSVSKMLTAIRVLQLAEQGLLDLDQPIATLLSDADMPAGKTPAELSVYQGQAIGGQITVRQLLNHRSGIHDYLFGEGSSGMTLAELMVLDATGVLPSGVSQKQWSSLALLDYFFQNGMGNLPYAVPDSRFFYTDSNYLLLGMIVEKLTGRSLADNYRDGIYSHADMPGAYLEWYEPAKSAAPVDHYLDASHDGLGNLNIVELEINTSLDWGGGGVVTDAVSLSNLLSALFNKHLLTQEASLAEMTSFSATDFPTNEFLTQYNYGLGLVERVYKLDKYRDVKLYGHDGFWGIHAYYEPKTQASIVLVLNQATADDRWIGDVVKALMKAKLFGI